MFFLKLFKHFFFFGHKELHTFVPCKPLIFATVKKFISFVQLDLLQFSLFASVFIYLLETRNLLFFTGRVIAFIIAPVHVRNLPYLFTSQQLVLGRLDTSHLHILNVLVSIKSAINDQIRALNILMLEDGRVILYKHPVIGIFQIGLVIQVLVSVE